MSKLEQIRNHLKIKDILEVAAGIVIVGTNAASVAQGFKIELDILNQKVDVVKKKDKFLKTKSDFETAVNYILIRQETREYIRKRIADYYKIDYHALNLEIKNFQSSGKEEYEYDGYFRKPKIFTYKKEMSFLQELNKWKESQSDAPCQLCVMHQLQCLIWQSIQNKDSYVQNNYNEIRYLIEFEMTYTTGMHDLLKKSEFD